MIRLRIALLAIVVTTGASTLLGCSAIGDTIHNEKATQFATVSDLSAEWDNTAAWVPTDGTDIKVRESTNGENAVLRVTSGTDLDPQACVVTERQSAPTYTDTWTPDAYVDDVWVCDGWAVIPTDDGWFGWTPIDPDEKAAAEEALGAK